MHIQVQSASSVAELSRKIRESGVSPSFLSVHCNADCRPDLPLEGVSSATALIGASSCQGVVATSDASEPVAAFIVSDADGSYGSAVLPLDGAPTEIARNATLAALEDAGRPGEKPDLVWVSGTPGTEEAILAGIESVLGPDVPIIGGSAADNSVEGNWFVFGKNAIYNDGVVISVLFPSTPVSFAYQNGYAPTANTGVVTRAKGRRVYEIDGRPAGEVLSEWSHGAVPSEDAGPEGRRIISESTFWPLGRRMNDFGGVSYYLLAHPAIAHASGAVDFFADVADGETLTQMQGSVEGLIERAGRVVALAKKAGDFQTAEVKGALIVYCGGCMLSIQDRLGDVAQSLRNELGQAPFVTCFTFGEQGPILGRGNRHGNLMISSIVFG